MYFQFSTWEFLKIDDMIILECTLVKHGDLWAELNYVSTVLIAETCKLVKKFRFRKKW